MFEKKKSTLFSESLETFVFTLKLPLVFRNRLVPQLNSRKESWRICFSARAEISPALKHFAWFVKRA